ncbi:hypothetical protein ACN20G_23310 [Streptomyces sp. BI20]|uniref:hypothetical protein n=1 Tax=Streptomyces sp. BI20 TaxID=3403460 RepID=UPI003C7930F8
MYDFDAEAGSRQGIHTFSVKYTVEGEEEHGHDQLTAAFRKSFPYRQDLILFVDGALAVYELVTLVAPPKWSAPLRGSKSLWAVELFAKHKQGSEITSRDLIMTLYADETWHARPLEGVPGAVAHESRHAGLLNETLDDEDPSDPLKEDAGQVSESCRGLYRCAPCTYQAQYDEKPDFSHRRHP